MITSQSIRADIGQRTVLILEGSDGGHRLVYVRLLVLEGKQRGLRVVVAAPRTVTSSRVWREHLSEIEASFETVSLDHFPVTSPEVQRVGRAVEADLILIPDGDLFTTYNALRWARGIPMRTLVMRDPRGEAGSLAVRLKGLAKRAVLALARLNPCIEVVWLSQFGDTNPRSNVALDPFVSFEPVDLVLARAPAYRVRLGMSDEVLWFAMVGGLSRRKNVVMAAECLAEYAQGAGRRVGLLLAGPIDGDLAASAEDLRQRLPDTIDVVIDAGLKTNDELNVAVAAADRVVVARGLHYPNSNLIKAVALGRPCVFAAPKRAKQRAKNLPAVYACDLTRDQLVRAVALCADQATSAPRGGFDANQFAGALLR